MKAKTILILNGPVSAGASAAADRYTGVTPEQVRVESAALCDELGIKLEFRQTDDRDEMYDWIARDANDFDALIINPAGYLNPANVDSESYRSAARKIAHLGKPVIEVHPANIFRQADEATSPLQGPDGETGLVCGLGLHGYLLGIKAVARRLKG